MGPPGRPGHRAGLLGARPSRPPGPWPSASVWRTPGSWWPTSTTPSRRSDATYDITYQSLGSLNWHPDMARWAEILHAADPPRRSLLPAGGATRWAGCSTTPARRSTTRTSTSPSGQRISDDGGHLRRHDRRRPCNNETIEFSHTLSDVISALLDAGFVLEQFAEHPFTVFEMWPWLEERDGQTSTWWAPEGRPDLPMMYSLVARKPGLSPHWVGSARVPWVYAFDHAHATPPRDLKDLLGGKGANLAEMTSVLDLPVPPGLHDHDRGLRGLPGRRLARRARRRDRRARGRPGEAMGRRLGRPGRPAAAQVRSGAKFSMPGMMDTVLNLGLTTSRSRASPRSQASGGSP